MSITSDPAAEIHVGQRVLIEGKTPGIIAALLPDGMFLIQTAADLVPLPPALLFWPDCGEEKREC